MLLGRPGRNTSPGKVRDTRHREEANRRGTPWGHTGPCRTAMITPTVDFEALRSELRATLRHGARARSLLDRMALVDLLNPAKPSEEAPPDAQRALEAARLVADTVDALDPPIDRIMSIMLCLAPGTAGMTLSARRRRAADLVDIQPVTFRTEERYEQAFVTELALALYGRLTGCT